MHYDDTGARDKNRMTMRQIMRDTDKRTDAPNRTCKAEKDKDASSNRTHKDLASLWRRIHGTLLALTQPSASSVITAIYLDSKLLSCLQILPAQPYPKSSTAYPRLPE